MRALVVMICSILFLAACRRSEKIPRHVLQREKMQAVLYDMVRADQFLTDFVLIRDSTLDREDESNRLYQQVFDQHGVTREQFRESLAFYNEHPGLFKIVLDSLYDGIIKISRDTRIPKLLPDSVSPQKEKRLLQ